MEIKVGRTYRCKRKKVFGIFDPVYDDREVLWISADESRVQYNSPSIKFGRRFPTVAMEQFKKWAFNDVTDRLIGDSWEEYHGK